MNALTSPRLLPVAEALSLILATAPERLELEHVPLRAGLGRTLGNGLRAARTQPPFPASAMDGYAVAAADLERPPTQLRVVGVSAAGNGYRGSLGRGEAVRIFTGAPLPCGADTVVIQEDVALDGDSVLIEDRVQQGKHVRAAGLDFQEGEELLAAGTRLGPRHLALAAAMNHPVLPVVRRPKVAILATGDELVAPGETPSKDQIIASNGFALASMVENAGGEAIDLGIARDTFESMAHAISQAHSAQADVLVTLGGASVGDHDLVQPALERSGMKLGFWKIAMRPGKPLLHGRLGPMRVLGLPGNPVSSIVCGLLFVVPLVRALLGDPDAAADPTEAAILGAPMGANDSRQDYLRATISRSDASTLPLAVPLERQDSSMLRHLARADCLIVRAPHAPAAAIGENCRVIRFRRFGM